MHGILGTRSRWVAHVVHARDHRTARGGRIAVLVGRTVSAMPLSGYPPSRQARIVVVVAQKPCTHRKTRRKSCPADCRCHSTCTPYHLRASLPSSAGMPSARVLPRRRATSSGFEIHRGEHSIRGSAHWLRTAERQLPRIGIDGTRFADCRVRHIAGHRLVNRCVVRCGAVGRVLAGICARVTRSVTAAVHRSIARCVGCGICDVSRFHGVCADVSPGCVREPRHAARRAVRVVGVRPLSESLFGRSNCNQCHWWLPHPCQPMRPKSGRSDFQRRRTGLSGGITIGQEQARRCQRRKRRGEPSRRGASGRAQEAPL